MMIDLGTEYETTELPKEDVATIQVISDGWHEGEPLRKSMLMIVEFVICPMAGRCQMAADGLCASSKVSSNRRGWCPWATIKVVRSKAHNAEMMAEIRQQPAYERLMPRRSRRFAVIGDQAYVNIGFRRRHDGTLGFMFEDDLDMLPGRRQVLDLGLPVPLGSSSGTVPLSSLTPQALAKIVTKEGFVGMLGYEASIFKADYAKMASQLLTDVRRCWPEGYAAFVSDFPQYADMATDNRGRYAKAGTCPDGARFGEGTSAFTKRGDRLETDGYEAYIHVLGASVSNAKLRIDITDSLIVKITDESQVSPLETIFV